MVATLHEVEAEPADWPASPALEPAEAALDPAFIWQRIEAWVSHRWTPREVVWIVEGPGEWVPRLTPAVIESVEVWSDGWQAVALDASPLGGYALPGEGPYRFTATAGGGTVPAAVNEAFRRLAEYFAGHDGRWSGATSEVEEIGEIKTSSERSVTWLARAMAYSGAADLLRPYRRL
ncbi:hypothetical protein [Rhodobacteraceae bacterium DSL-40]|uniref:hypothetical protein n=1 Tax=Amaricoccus sp. B4 TaxID=3368557 RepID=UPI000DAD8C2A